jgi:translation initiation factor 5B
MNYFESILYDGMIEKGDEIAIASFGEPIIARIRSIDEILPLSEKFQSREKVTAATGIRIQLAERADILPGMPFQIYKNNIEEIKKLFKKEILEAIKTDKQGIIAKAESLGSLEALLTLLRQANISVIKAGIGTINKQDITTAKTNLENQPENAVIAGFNVGLEADIVENEIGKVKIIKDDVVYKLIENLQEYQLKKRIEIEKERMLGLATICKLEILHQYVFHNTKPAIFGVKVLGGKLKAGIPLINEEGEEISRVKQIQSEGKTVEKAEKDMEVAISLPGANYERELKDKRFLYANLSESQVKNFRKNKDLLSSDEISILQEVLQIKRKAKADWGM